MESIFTKEISRLFHRFDLEQIVAVAFAVHKIIRDTLPPFPLERLAQVGTKAWILVTKHGVFDGNLVHVSALLLLKGNLSACCGLPGANGEFRMVKLVISSDGELRTKCRSMRPLGHSGAHGPEVNFDRGDACVFIVRVSGERSFDKL